MSLDPNDGSQHWMIEGPTEQFVASLVYDGNLLFMAAGFPTYHVLGIRPTDIVYSAAKLFFAYGLGNSGYFPAGVGAQCVLYPQRPTPEAVFALLDRHRPTLLFAGPALYAAMLAVKDGAPHDLSSLRLCVSAGEALPEEIYTRWRDRFGVEIIDGIGTTECLHMFISNRPGAVRPGSSGLPVPGYEAAIVDDDGRPVPTGEIGNLRVKGDSIMSGYWNQEEKTKATLIGAWIHTGDKYYRDALGYFWYCGRADDMLKVSGAWVSPVEVEATLVKHPAVLQAAVVAQGLQVAAPPGRPREKADGADVGGHGASSQSLTTAIWCAAISDGACPASANSTSRAPGPRWVIASAVSRSSRSDRPPRTTSTGHPTFSHSGQRSTSLGGPAKARPIAGS